MFQDCFKYLTTLRFRLHHFYAFSGLATEARSRIRCDAYATNNAAEKRLDEITFIHDRWSYGSVD